MGDVLFHLEDAIRSKKEPLTLQEANILLAWRAEAMRGFTIGLGGGSIVAWLATRRLGKLFRFNITLGAAAVCGIWSLERSVKSSAERILSLEGSRIQKELANIMLRKYGNNSWALEHLSKHFYSEEVYDDSSVDKPKRRWRFRNISGESISHHHQNTSYSEETNSQHDDVKKTSAEPKQVPVNAASDAMEDPFDLIFGISESAESVPDPDAATKSSTDTSATSSIDTSTLTRRQKRALRRRRRHREEEDSN